MGKWWQTKSKDSIHKIAMNPLVFHTRDFWPSLHLSLQLWKLVNRKLIICICKALKLLKVLHHDELFHKVHVVTLGVWLGMCFVCCSPMSMSICQNSEPQLVSLIPGKEHRLARMKIENILLVHSERVFKYWCLPTTWHLQQETDHCSAGIVAELYHLWKCALQSDV
jgi:hypothetical protein